MDSLLNHQRPPVFCPGCSHERVVQALDHACRQMNLPGHKIVLVSDIGCSGLFDTFFHTHALHGLHGRALTYATGIKMARPDLTVIVTMGDGGLGIGGAHVLSTCRRNLNLTLLVLNNFNYGMTGGQCSVTTPEDAMVGSGFLNRLEKPIDICQVAGTAGAGYVARLSTYQKDLAEKLADAIEFNGFSLVDIHGVCTGRYTRKNKLTPRVIAENIRHLPPVAHFQEINARAEYGRHYRREAAKLTPVIEPVPIESTSVTSEMEDPASLNRHEVVILGSAGQRIITAGEILCLAGIRAGRHATQKNDYPITVLRGHSISELILSTEPIDYTGIVSPSVVMVLASEGVDRRREMLATLPETTVVIQVKGVEMPAGRARITEVDFQAHQVKSPDWAMAMLAILAAQHIMITTDLLKFAIRQKFPESVSAKVIPLIDRVTRFAASLDYPVA